jgi:molybdopterin-guanine dinucleotide biosynthesis protein A
MLKIPCVILCGGKSSRMGENKALLPFGDEKTLLEFQHERLKKIFEKVYISTKHKDTINFECEIIEDENSDIFSPAHALYCIIKKLKSPFFAMSVDTPFVDECAIKRVFQAFDGVSTFPKVKYKIHSLCGIYTQDIAIVLENMLKDDIHKLKILIDKIPHKIVDFEDENIFLNINSKNDYDKAKNLLIKNLDKQ